MKPKSPLRRKRKIAFRPPGAPCSPEERCRSRYFARHAVDVSAIEDRNDPTSVLLRTLSEQECARFRNRNLRQPGRDRRVHAVELRPWIGGLKLPAPACHQPVATLALAGESLAVTAPVDCARCLADNPDPFAPLVALDGGQLPLPLEPPGHEDERGA